MTTLERNEYKRFAKKACKENGIKVNMKNMILLETGSGNGALHFVGNKELYIYYVMFEDGKTGKQYQCTYSVNNYTANHRSLYFVSEYEF